jgi:hypothetical protein
MREICCLHLQDRGVLKFQKVNFVGTVSGVTISGLFSRAILEPAAACATWNTCTLEHRGLRLADIAICGSRINRLYSLD